MGFPFGGIRDYGCDFTCLRTLVVEGTRWGGISRDEKFDQMSVYLPCMLHAGNHLLPNITAFCVGNGILLKPCLRGEQADGELRSPLWDTL